MRRYYSYERKLSADALDAANSMFRTFNREFFDNTLPDVEFRYILSKSGLAADYKAGMIRLALPLRLMLKNEMRRLLFDNGLETRVAADIMHELVHHWQRPVKAAKRFPFSEYRKLYEAGMTDEIARRERENKEADIMHDAGFIEKIRSAGVYETYSGKNLQYTQFDEIRKDSPLDALLHEKEFMDMCLVLKADMEKTLDDERKRRVKLLIARGGMEERFRKFFESDI